MKSLCEIRDTPEYKALVIGLTPAYAEFAGWEADRDYLSYGRVRTTEEAMENPAPNAPEKTSDSLAPMRPVKVSDTKLALFKKAVKLGKAQVSELNKALINGRVIAANGKLGTSYYIKFTQVGQADIFTWKIEDMSKPASGEQTTMFYRDMTQAPITNTDKIRSTEILDKFAAQLTQSTGVSTARITADEAREITKNSTNPYINEPAFFHDGVIYFVGDNLSTKLILHEFAHPILRSIAADNPKLFTKLFSDLLATPEGADAAEMVRVKYPELANNDARFKEEVLAHALQAAAQDKADNRLQSTGFAKVIKDLLYAMKQLLRKAFGQKIDIAKMDVDTTLDQLADMLVKGGNFDIVTENITDADLVAYHKAEEDYLNDLLKIGRPELETLVNKYFERINKHSRQVQKSGDYDAIKDFLTNTGKYGDLDLMWRNLKEYQGQIQDRMGEAISDEQYQEEATKALLKSLFVLQNMMEKVRGHLADISMDIDNKDNIQRAKYYQDAIQHWDRFLDDAKPYIRDNRSPLAELIKDINGNIESSKDLLNEIAYKASGDVLAEVLEGFMSNIDTFYKERVADLKKRGASKEIIDQVEREYKATMLNRSKIDEALRGQLTDEFGKIKDASVIGSFLEGFSYNADPVVGGLAKYIRDGLTDVLVKAQRNFNDFATEMKPLWDETGYNPNRPGDYGERLGQLEEVGYIENGEFKKKNVWRFLNKYKGWDVVEDEYRFKISAAGDKYEETKSEEDRKVLYDLQQEWRQHINDYAHQKYKPEFYERFALLEKDEVGREAAGRRNDIYREIANLRIPFTGQDELDIADQRESLQRQLRQLSDVRDAGGRPKTGKELAIAERMKEYNDKTKEFYRTEAREGAFQSALTAFEEKLIGEGKFRGSELFDTMRAAWIEKNTRIVIKQEFWDEFNHVSEKIKELMALIPQHQQTELDISEAYETIREALTGYKDEDGQPVGAEMTAERLKLVKDAQDAIIKAQDNLTKLSGLTRKENYELSEIHERFMAHTHTKQDLARWDELAQRKSQLPLDKYQRAALKGYFAQMDQLRKKDPTDSYIDTVNNWLSTLDMKEMYQDMRENGITKSTAYYILNDDTVDTLTAQSPEFEAWFKANHIRKPSFDPLLGQETERWERTAAWNVIRPNDDAYYEKTTLEDGEEIIGLPSQKYSDRYVKDEYYTEKIVGETIDNRGNWLPRTMAEGAKDDRYLNQDYEKMRREDSKLFNVLNKMTAYHLKNQEGLEDNKKLWLDMPRYRKQGLERVQGGNLLQRIVESIKNFWIQTKDGYNNGFNYDNGAQLMKLDMMDDNSTRVPITGLSNIDADEVSTDIPYTMMRYMISAERNKKLVEMLPTVEAIQQTVNADINQPSAQSSYKNRTIINLGKKKEKYIRAQAVNNMIATTFAGEQNTGALSENAMAQNFSKMLFKNASFAYLAMNIPSAIKNAVGAKFQGLIEAAAGKYMTAATFVKGEAWAATQTAKISFEIYKQGPKSHDLQLIEIFDPTTGRFEQTFGEALTRTPVKDTLNILERLSDFRKWTQLQAELQTFAAMMYHTRVEKNGEMIEYMDAWETKDGKIQLKGGVDPSWGITYDQDGTQHIGQKFKDKKNEMQRVLANLNGAYGQQDSPEANRYLMFRYISFLRRWFTAMFQNRFAHSGSLLKGTSRGRADYLLGSQKEGYYITSLKTTLKALRTGGKYLPYMNTDERAAFIRFGVEAGTLILLSALAGILFSFDPDDDDRFEKLKKKSGALYIPGLTEEDPQHPFHVGGWLSNHALLMMMATNQENSQFLSLRGYTNMADLKSLTFGPTLATWEKVGKDLYYEATGDEHALYQKDVGSYSFQQENSHKIWNHLAGAIGLSGKSVEPVGTIKNMEAFKNR